MGRIAKPHTPWSEAMASLRILLDRRVGPRVVIAAYIVGGMLWSASVGLMLVP